MLFESERKGNNRSPTFSGLCFDEIQHPGLQIIRVGDHLAACDLFRRSPVIAKVAYPQPAVGTNGWTKDPAGHRSRVIEIAGSGRGIRAGQGSSLANSSNLLLGFFGFTEDSGLQHPPERSSAIFRTLDCALCFTLAARGGSCFSNSLKPFRNRNASS